MSRYSSTSYKNDGKQSEDIDTRIGEKNSIVLISSVLVTKQEFANTENLSL